MTQEVKRIYCGTAGLSNVGQKAQIYGWVNSRRDHGGVVFIDLRDISGVCQVVFDAKIDKQAYLLGDELRSEYCVMVRGTFRKRSADTVNPKMATGQIELAAEELQVFSKSKALPFPLEHAALANEKTRLKYRYLDLRRYDLQKNFLLRSEINQWLRNFFMARNFHEIETPFLTKSTPEGARDYLVPSRLGSGDFYALPQSPQLFKQILMVAGFDRYFQIVKCFRDEDLRGNRQPEFTQIDLELSFVSQEEVITLVEELLSGLFAKFKKINIARPFRRLTYQQAISDYGLDKPDLRFDLKLQDITALVKDVEFKVFQSAVAKGGIVNCILVPGGESLSRKDLDELTEFVKIYNAKGLAWAKVLPDGWQSPIAKFLSTEVKNAIVKQVGAAPKDLLLFGADQPKVVRSALGHLRGELAKKLGLIAEDRFVFCWVTDFPLLEYNDDEKRWQSMHHPFTLPQLEDLAKYKEQSPEKIKAHAYDITLNGVELGGGSLRIYDSELQMQMFDLIKMPQDEAKSRFGFLLEALEFGAPPHGGIALGLDRLIMSLLGGGSSIRDVITFPKTQHAACLMTEAPSQVSQKQLQELHLKVLKKLARDNPTQTS